MMKWVLPLIFMSTNVLAEMAPGRDPNLDMHKSPSPQILEAGLNGKKCQNGCGHQKTVDVSRFDEDSLVKPRTVETSSQNGRK